MGGKCCSWLATASTVLGIYFGVTIFFLFTFYYHNNHAGTWGLFSAIFASICLHLRLLKSNNRLSGWYSVSQLNSLAAFGFICFCISLGSTSWYIIYAAYHAIPLLPVETSYYLAAVWAGMTAKWSFCVFLTGYRYSRFLRYSTPFLVIQDTDGEHA